MYIDGASDLRPRFIPSIPTANCAEFQIAFVEIRESFV